MLHHDGSREKPEAAQPDLDDLFSLYRMSLVLRSLFPVERLLARRGVTIGYPHCLPSDGGSLRKERRTFLGQMHLSSHASFLRSLLTTVNVA